MVVEENALGLKGTPLCTVDMGVYGGDRRRFVTGSQGLYDRQVFFHDGHHEVRQHPGMGIGDQPDLDRIDAVNL